MPPGGSTGTRSRTVSINFGFSEHVLKPFVNNKPLELFDTSYVDGAGRRRSIAPASSCEDIG